MNVSENIFIKAPTDRKLDKKIQNNNKRQCLSNVLSYRHSNALTLSIPLPVYVFSNACRHTKWLLRQNSTTIHHTLPRSRPRRRRCSPYFQLIARAQHKNSLCFSMFIPYTFARLREFLSVSVSGGYTHTNAVMYAFHTGRSEQYNAVLHLRRV